MPGPRIKYFLSHQPDSVGRVDKGESPENSLFAATDNQILSEPPDRLLRSSGRDGRPLPTFFVSPVFKNQILSCPRRHKASVGPMEKRHCSTNVFVSPVIKKQVLCPVAKIPNTSFSGRATGFWYPILRSSVSPNVFVSLLAQNELPSFPNLHTASVVRVNRAAPPPENPPLYCDRKSNNMYTAPANGSCWAKSQSTVSKKLFGYLVIKKQILPSQRLQTDSPSRVDPEEKKTHSRLPERCPRPQKKYGQQQKGFHFFAMATAPSSSPSLLSSPLLSSSPLFSPLLSFPLLSPPLLSLFVSTLFISPLEIIRFAPI